MTEPKYPTYQEMADHYFKRTGLIPPTFRGRLSIEMGRRGKSGLREPWLYVTFRCPYCRYPHHHTWGIGEPEPTHRMSHCTDGSPYRKHGYFVFPFDTKQNRRVMAEYERLEEEYMLREDMAFSRMATELPSGDSL